VRRRAQADPRSGGRDEAISRRIREESLQPLPLVVTPTCKGPSVCVASRENVQSCGASATFTGTRCLLQTFEICAPMIMLETSILKGT
jgi:hypothetical protein